MTTPHPADSKIFFDDNSYVELVGISVTENDILDVMALHKSNVSRSSSVWRQALFLRMFEELKVGPLYFPTITFHVFAQPVVRERWFYSRSLPRWRQGEDEYKGFLWGEDQQDVAATVIHQLDWVRDYTDFYVQAPLYTWLRWLYARKHDVNNQLDKCANVVEQFIAESFANVYYAWQQYTEGTHITKEEREELQTLLAGKVVSTRLYHKITGETL